MTILNELVVSANCRIREVLERIDRGAKGIVLVLDDEQHLIATVTDGDVRRAILAGMDLELSVQDLLAQRDPTFHSGPVTAPNGTPDAELLHVMTETTLRQIPLVDDDGRVISIALLSELVKEYDLPLRALVMAGGYGTRLRPLTDELPKPMLPLGSRPLLELIVEQLRDAGIRQVNVATHYKGSPFGIDRTTEGLSR